MRGKFQNTIVLLLLAFTALLPLKCGNLILPGVPHSWPEDWIGWVVTAPPAAFFVIVSGGLLLLMLAAFGVPDEARRGRPGWTLLLWLLLLPVGALGLIRASSLEPGVVELCYFSGLSAYAGCVWILLAQRRDDWRTALLGAAAVGVLITAAAGVYQYCFGFDELRRYVLEQEKISGAAFSDDFKARLWDVRTYATFTFASALAGCLLLTGPLTVTLLWRWGRRFEPARLSQWLFAGLGGLMLAGVFAATKGRGAFLAAVLAAAFLGVLRLKSRKLKLAVVLCGVAVIIGGAVYIQCAGRGFGSMTERVGYLITSARMLGDEPLCGEGWGDFTHRHARMKFLGNEELAKDPHNIVASFAAQTGTPGLIYVLALLIVPWLGALRVCLRRRECAWRWALFGGLTAFYLHAMMDLDMQVPGLMALMIMAQFALQEASDAVAPPSKRRSWRRWGLGGVLGLLGVLAMLAGMHWSHADGKLERLLDASGQSVGAVGKPSGTQSRVRQLVDEAAAAAPYAMSPWLAGGNYMLKAGNLNQAERYFLEARRRSPEYWLLFARLGDLYELRGDQLQAEQFRNEADRRFPLNKQIKEEKARRQNE